MRDARHIAALLVSLLVMSVLIGCNRSALVNQNIEPNNSGFAATNRNDSEHGQEVESPLPKPTGLVNDYAQVIDVESKRRLDRLLTGLLKRAEIGFVVATVETTGGQSVDDYSLAVARGWKVGSKNGGILLLLAIKDRKWRIQVTRQLEGDLPDEEVAKFGQLMMPAAREGRYGEGVEKCARAIIERLAQRRGFKLEE
ncbi:MAG TPA: TPM domain-containing protein [Pyrinomonadaceae bacterium]|jgi:uncharacterized protein